MSNLIAHCDSRYVSDVNEIYKVPTAPGSPAGTKRPYQPVSHGMVRDAMMKVIASVGLAVLSERWALSVPMRESKSKLKSDKSDPTIYTGPGARMFGLIVYGRKGDTDADGFSRALGVRNSQDKTLAHSLAGGANVMVCDNLVLAGDFVTFRKHTRFIDIMADTMRAVQTVLSQADPFINFMRTLKTVECPDAAFNGLICDGMRAGILPGASGREMLEAWYDAKAPSDRADFGQRLSDGVYAPRTAWTAHGLWTDLVQKRQNLTASGSEMIETQATLNNIMRKRLPLIDAVVIPSVN